MKSVVVEASTVAKAIELAWQKAEKPEEFFIRILQEHSSGFLGFGAQKAKVVFFFKNTQKSDSLFPVILKQKEYANLFRNDKLKAPSQLNVIDDELNKNISLGQKKKQHSPNKPKQIHQARSATPDAKSTHSQPLPVKNQQQVKPQVQANKTQVKLELPGKPVVKQAPQVKKEEIVKKIHVQAPSVSQVPKVAAQPKVVVSQVPVIQKVEDVVKPQSSVIAPVTPAPRVIQKMKRRPLTGADQGVSGITRSSQGKTQSTSGITRKATVDVIGSKPSAVLDSVNSTLDKGDQE